MVITKQLQEQAFLTVYCESCLSNFYPFSALLVDLFSAFYLHFFFFFLFFLGLQEGLKGQTKNGTKSETKKVVGL